MTYLIYNKDDLNNLIDIIELTDKQKIIFEKENKDKLLLLTKEFEQNNFEESEDDFEILEFGQLESSGEVKEW